MAWHKRLYIEEWVSSIHNVARWLLYKTLKNTTMKSKEELTRELVAEAKEKAEQLWMDQQKETKVKIAEFGKSLGCDDTQALIKLIGEVNGLFRYKTQRVKVTPEIEQLIREKAKLMIPKDIAASLSVSVGQVNKVLKTKN